MKLWLSRWALPLLVTAFLASCRADAPDRPFLSSLFTDDMVLQRGLSDSVCGWTTPGVAVLHLGLVDDADTPTQRSSTS